MKRLAHASIWAPNGVSAKDWRFRGILRFVLPVTDAAVLFFAVVFLIAGMPSLGSFVGHEAAEWWCRGVAASAFLSLAGVSFPKLWVVEIIGRTVWVALIVGYMAMFLPMIGNPQVVASVVLNLVLIVLPVWRVGDLGFVAWQRGHVARLPR